MTLHAFSQIFQFADDHCVDGTKFMAKTANYIIEYHSQYRSTYIKDADGNTIDGGMSLVDAVNLLFIMGEN